MQVRSDPTPMHCSIGIGKVDPLYYVLLCKRGSQQAATQAPQSAMKRVSWSKQAKAALHAFNQAQAGDGRTASGCDVVRQPTAPAHPDVVWQQPDCIQHLEQQVSARSLIQLKQLRDMHIQQPHIPALSPQMPLTGDQLGADNQREHSKLKF